MYKSFQLIKNIHVIMMCTAKERLCSSKLRRLRMYMYNTWRELVVRVMV